MSNINSNKNTVRQYDNKVSNSNDFIVYDHCCAIEFVVSMGGSGDSSFQLI